MDLERYIKLSDRIHAVDSKHQFIKYPYAELLEKHGKDGGSPVVIQKSATSLARDRESPFGEYAIVSRDRVNAKGESEGTFVEIQSKTMQRALHSILGGHFQATIRANPIIFRKPYYSLFHCRHEIRNLAQKESNTQEDKQHFEWLLNFMSDNLKPLEKVQDGLVEKGLIEFKHLPIIFEAGSIVVGQQRGEGEKTVKRDTVEKTVRPECFLFHEIGDELEDKMTGTKFIDIEVLRWAYNGSMFGLAMERLRIKEFIGPRKITELDCFPLKFMTDEEKNKLIPQLISRGKKWCEQVESKIFQYKGTAQSPTRATWSWEVKILSKNMPGRVMLDHLAFMEAFPELNRPLHHRARENVEENGNTADELLCPSDTWNLSSQVTMPRGDLWNWIDKDGYHPTQAQALLCPATSVGYSLAQKDWGYFDIDLLEDVNWALSPAKGLEIPLTQKEMLRDLIMEHHSKPRSNAIASGKGEGLIFLLYGPPGCGKTLTAELMAEEDKRPLVRISCGDLGQHPYEVERNLQALLNLAMRGSAIVLIDEADTFIAKRSMGGGIRDYYHNTLVSIFLKHLEYFPGVLFLTTNEETGIDEAIKSRVIFLRYGELSTKSRINIWKNQLSKGQYALEENILQSICEELGNKYELDGREIQTLAHVSLTICRRRKQEVSKEIIQELYDLIHGTRKL